MSRCPGQLGAFDAGDARFARFAEALVAGSVLLDETVQHHLTTARHRQVRGHGRRHRDLRLSGYEVYRFGHDELRDETTARILLGAFLPRLFQHHEVTGRH
ncbi:hypothetical protein [Streptomyces sp. NPDC054808]